MKFRLATKAILAASLVASASAGVEGTAQKENAAVRGRSDAAAEAKEKMAGLNDALRRLREEWEHDGENPYPPCEYDDDYDCIDHSLIAHFVDIGKHIKSMFYGNRHQIADGLKDFKHALLDVANTTIEDHVFTHGHTASSVPDGNHSHSIDETDTQDAGNHKHTIPNVADHKHTLPNLICNTTCWYEDEKTETEPAGGHNHTGMTGEEGVHNHTFTADTDMVGPHEHGITVNDTTLTLNHTTELFEELEKAADVLWDLIEDLKNKTKFSHKHKFKGGKHDGEWEYEPKWPEYGHPYEYHDQGEYTEYDHDDEGWGQYGPP